MMGSSGLPPEYWMGRPGFPELMAALGVDRGQTRLVGGAVRDWLAGLPVADIDLATRLLPDEVLARLEEAGIRAVPTGLRHGTITAIVAGQPHEVTTLRRDVETDGRHARVAFTSDWQEDAARRDFTINALFAEPLTGELFDYFDGRRDLAARVVRFIGDPDTRIREDHLRILRFFRFSARYADAIDREGLAAAMRHREALLALSRERIRDELLKLLALPRPVATVAVMVEAGILGVVLAEVGAEALPRLAATIAWEQKVDARPHPIRRLAALLPPEPALARAVASRLRLSKAETVRLEAATDPAPIPSDPRIHAFVSGAEATLDRMLITGDPRTPHWRAVLDGWRRPRLPVSGRDLIAMGVPPGPEVSRLLTLVEQKWMAAGFPPDRAKAAAIAREVTGHR
jgi:poly(A) polymerase